MTTVEMIAALRRVANTLDMSFYNSLVTGRVVDFSEFSWTMQNLVAAVETLERTPSEKFDRGFTELHDELMQELNQFDTPGDFLGRFRAAQIMSGYARTIMTKAGIRG